MDLHSALSIYTATGLLNNSQLMEFLKLSELGVGLWSQKAEITPQ